MAARSKVRPGFRRVLHLLVALSFLLLLDGVPALAQAGGLTVQIYDADSDEALPGVSVLLSNTHQLVAPTTVRTDTDGRVEFPVLRAGGSYVLEVSMPGFARQRVPDIKVHSGQVRQIVLKLSPEMQESVRVVGLRDIVDIDTTQTSTRFSDDFIEQLPIPGRFYQNILQMAPGVNDADDDGNPNVHGARSRDFKAEVGGVSNVDPLTGERLSFVSLESIEDIEIIQAGAGVEFGRAQGGFARIIQKQGSNEFEGVFSMIYASSELDGSGATSLPEDRIPEFERVQPAIQISGPIVRDRMWYRLSYEYIDREDPVNVLSAVETTRLTQEIVSTQITWQASPRNKLSFQYQSDPFERTNIDISATIPSESTQSIEQSGDTFSIKWVAPHSSRLLVESVAAYQDHAFKIAPTQPRAQQDCVHFFVFTTLNEARCLFTNNATISGGHPETWSDKRQRLTVRSQATWYLGRFAGVSHQIKFGLIIENERYFRDLNRRPDVQFTAFFPSIGDPFGIATAEVPVPAFSRSRATGTSWGLYLEEKLKPTSGLAITLGVRLDRESIRSNGMEDFDPAAEANAYFKGFEHGGNPAFLAPNIFTANPDIRTFQNDAAEALEIDPSDIPLDANAVQSAFWRNRRDLVEVDITDTRPSPRASIAWDPWSNGKTKFAVSAGRYYDKMFLAVPLLELEPATTNLSFFAFQISPLALDFGVFSAGGNGVSPIVNINMVVRDLKTPYQDELVASFERSLWPETSVKLTYISREFEDQLQNVDINHVGNTVLNPVWGEILLLGNFNSAEYTAGMVELVRRQYRGWQMNASYIWSEAIGDAEDFDQLLGNNRDLRDSERGFLDYDQRHIVRFNVTTIAPKGWRLGMAVRWESGLPYSNVYSRFVQFETPPEYFTIGAPTRRTDFVYGGGRRNDQRNESFWNFDLRVARDLFLAGGTSAQLTVEVFNLLNDDPLLEDDRLNGAVSPSRDFGRRYQVGLRVAF